MNYSDAKAEALSTLVPEPGEEFWFAKTILGDTVLIRVDSVSNRLVLYTIIHSHEGWQRRSDKGEVRLVAWWRAMTRGHIHANNTTGRAARVRTVQSAVS